MDRTKVNSQRYAGPDGEVVTDWQISLGVQSERIDRAERTDEGYCIDGVEHSPVGQK